MTRTLGFKRGMVVLAAGLAALVLAILPAAPASAAYYTFKTQYCSGTWYDGGNYMSASKYTCASGHKLKLCIVYQYPNTGVITACSAVRSSGFLYVSSVSGGAGSTVYTKIIQSI